MKKDLLRLLFFVFGISFFANAYSWEYEVNGIYYNDVNNKPGEWEVRYNTYGNTYTGDVVIPSTVEYSGQTYTVTGIGVSAFAQCPGLTSVTIPSTVTNIENQAFYNCPNLTTIKGAEGVTTIGESCFWLCKALTTLPLSNTLTTISKDAFRYVPFKSVTLPTSVSSLGSGVFYGCDSLTTLSLPEGITEIGENLCYGCSHLTAVTIPSTVKSIGKNAFYNCTQLPVITLPATLETIGDYAFYNCTQLTAITIPASVTSIGNMSFRSCWILKDKFTNNSSLTSSTNWGCTLVSERTNDGVCITDGKIVNILPGSQSITIPSTVNSIDNTVTFGNNNITSVEIHSNALVSQSYTGASNLNYFLGKKVRKFILGDEITSIGVSAFDSSDSLRTVSIGSNVTSIGESAFGSCKKLESIDIPSSVTTVGERSFAGCTNVKTVVIPSSITSFGNHCFYNVTGAATIGCKIPKYSYYSSSTLKHYTDSPFYSSSFSAITFTSDVDSIGDYAFYDTNNSCKSITIPSNVTYIGTGAFTGLQNLEYVNLDCDAACDGAVKVTNAKTIIIGDHVTTISRWAFSNCQLLETPAYNSKIFVRMPVTSTGEYTVPDGITEIASNAFNSCSLLTKITVPETVTKVGYDAFNGCSGLTSAVCNSKLFMKLPASTTGTYSITDGTTEITNGAFQNCNTVTGVTMPNSIQTVAENAFSGCTGMLSDVKNDHLLAFVSPKAKGKYTIPDNITAITKGAFLCGNSITSLVLGAKIDSLDYFILNGTNHLDSLYVNPGFKKFGTMDCFYVSKIFVTDLAAWCKVGFHSNWHYGTWHLYLNNEEIKDLVIPTGVSTIQEEQFAECKSFKSVTLPQGVTTIGRHAFLRCDSITKIVIPSSVSTIGEDAFYLISMLKSDFQNGSSLDAAANNYWGATMYDSHNNGLWIKDNEVVKYDGTASEVVIPEGVTRIQYNVFLNHSEITSVSLPSTLTSIWDRAFQKCTGLTSVTLPEAATSLSSDIFRGCSNLKSATLSSRLTEIPSGLFYGCTSLKTVDIPSTVTKIYSNAFNNCRAMKLASLPEALTEIGDSAFARCSGLESIIIPNTVTKIGTAAFYYCRNTQKIDVPNSVTSLGKSAFYSCAGVVTVDCNLPNCSLTDEGIFANGYITKVTFGDHVTTIGAHAFAYNSNLKTVHLSSTVTSIGEQAFYYCKLSEFYCLTPSVPTTGSDVFYSNYIKDTADTLYVNSGMVDLFKAADNWKLWANIAGAIYSAPTVEVVAQGKARVSTKILEDNAIKSTGIEWRRIDWTDDMASNTAATSHYKMLSQGFLNNLYTEKFWKVRAYYKDATDATYYSEWKTFDPADFSFYEPVIHTNDSVVTASNSNSVTIQVYAMQGTDDIQAQGVYYWKSNTSSPAKGMISTATPTIPADAKKIEATGNVMSITLKDLDASTGYTYVSFATTSTGSTYYGETCKFVTKESPAPTGIEELSSADDDSNTSAPVATAIYDVNGHRLSALHKGLNIIRYSNGTVKKVYIK